MSLVKGLGSFIGALILFAFLSMEHAEFLPVNLIPPLSSFLNGFFLIGPFLFVPIVNFVILWLVIAVIVSLV